LEVGLDEIFVDVRQLTDNDVLEIQATEQLQRSDLHELEEAEHYDRMVKAGYEPATIEEEDLAGDVPRSDTGTTVAEDSRGELANPPRAR
jgi:ParB-like chromosome segregation protein Spo0J